MLQSLWKRVLQGAAVIAEFQARLMMNLFYLLLGPVGLYLRSADPLGIRRGAFTGWREHPEPALPARESASKQS